MAESNTRVVLFCDCHQFSLVQLSLGDRTFGFLDELYRRGGECLVRNGGRIIKYLGDAILATFLGDCGDDAVLAAECLRREYAVLVREHGIDLETDMEVGLSLGDVQEGELGHDTLRGFDVFGECVNEAAMIGHHRGIAVTGALRTRLSAAIRVRELEPYRPKWRATPLEVWEVVGRD